MAFSIAVSTTDDGLVAITITDDAGAKIIPLRPYEAHQVATDLLNGAAIASTVRQPSRIILPDDIRQRFEKRGAL